MKITYIFTILLLSISLLFAFSLTSSASAGALIAPTSICGGQHIPLTTQRARNKARTVLKCMHNYARNHQGKSSLHLNRNLNKSAKKKNADIRRCGFVHNACGRVWYYWINVFYHPGGNSWTGENIGKEAYTANSIMTAWLHSTGHRRNILSSDFTQVGFNIAWKAGNHYNIPFWVAHFG